MRVFLKTMFFMFIFFLGFVFEGYSQRIANHDYPRIATLSWMGGNIKWLSRFDLILAGTTNDSLIFRSVKSVNPDAYILYTCDWNSGGPFRIWGEWESFPVQWRLRHSDGSYVRHTTGAYFADPTDYCGLYNSEKYNAGLPRRLMEIVDWSAFDGVSSDGTWSFPFNTGDNIDLDRNGVNDYIEHGEEWIRIKWQAGQNKIRTNLRNKYNLKWGNPNAKLIFFWTINDTMCIRVSNGMGWENMYQNSPKTFIDGYNLFNQWDTIGVLPRINVITFDLNYDISHAPVNRPKDYFRFMRFGLCTALLHDVYFMSGDLRDHHWANYYDEYDVKLGYPKGKAKKLSNGCYVRFFDNGVSIVNPTSSNKTVTNSDLAGLSGYDGPYYRFKGNQDPTWNDGSLFISVSLVSTAASGGSQNIGDGIILVRTPTAIASDIIIDNAYSGTSPGSNKAILAGFTWDQSAEYATNPSWYTSSQSSFANSNYYDSYYAPAGTGLAKAVFKPTINLPGQYRVYEWHGWRGKDSWNYREANNVPCSIIHANGTTNLTIDQTKNYGTWNLLGTFDFTNDGKDSVVITNNANGYVIADAFRFEYMSGSDIPPPVPPNPPQQSSPQNGALHQSTTLNIVWNKVISALQYHLQLASDSSFQTLVLNDSLMIDTIKQVASLSNAQTYYWRVRASNSYGTGSWSVIWKFRTIANLFIDGAVLFDKNNNRTKDTDDAGLTGWKVYLQGAISDSTITGIDGSYIFNNLPIGSYTIRIYVLPGWTQTIPSQPQTYSVTLDTTRTSASCNFLNYASSVVKCNYMDGWNAVSLPVNVISGKHKDIFPSSTSPVFYYQTSYVVAESLKLGLGYWLKFQQSQAVWIAGSKVNNDTIDVIVGWNLIGSISDSFPVASLTTSPDGIISSFLFGFINGLVPVDTIIPGNGYWVKTDQPGKLIFSAPKQIVSKNNDDFHSFELMNSLAFYSNNSQSRKIFFTENVNSRQLISRTLLPPSIAEIFDVRFFNEKYPGSFAALLENSQSENQGVPIILRSASYPLTIKWQIIDPERSYQLESNAGEKIILRGNGEITLENNQSKSENEEEIFTLKVLKQSESALPSFFDLTQNYPNPFNNRTSVSLSLPNDSHVRLEVYNILGKHVTTWLDRDIEAGNHILYFDASELASGVYFYRVAFKTSADSPLTQIKRMILVK